MGKNVGIEKIKSEGINFKTRQKEKNKNDGKITRRK